MLRGSSELSANTPVIWLDSYKTLIVTHINQCNLVPSLQWKTFSFQNIFINQIRHIILGQMANPNCGKLIILSELRSAPFPIPLLIFSRTWISVFSSSCREFRKIDIQLRFLVITIHAPKWSILQISLLLHFTSKWDPQWIDHMTREP